MDWRYELDLDSHSTTAHPLFVDPDGSDNLLGFSTLAVAGSERIVDNDDPGFTASGSWTSNSATDSTADRC